MQQIGKLLVGAIAAVIGFVTVQYLMGSSLFGSRTPTKAEITEMILDIPGASTLQTLHDRAPDDFDRIITRAMTLIEDGQTERAFAEGQRIAIDIRRTRADDLWKAPSASVSNVLTANADFYEFLSDDPQTCASVVAMGPAAIDRDFVMENLVEINKPADALFNAVFDGGEASGPAVRPPTDSQIDAAIIAWEATHGDAGLMDGLTNPHPNNARTCAAYIEFFRYLAAQTDEGTDQVRRQLVIDMAKS